MTPTGMRVRALKRACEAYHFEEHCDDRFKVEYRLEADCMVITSLELARGRNLEAFKRWLETRNI